MSSFEILRATSRRVFSEWRAVSTRDAGWMELEEELAEAELKSELLDDEDDDEDDDMLVRRDGGGGK